ncbi:nucleoside transporter-domain-containing protein [Glomus cerebriforme]|uniref:Nucleoside transporter-domain-containing protein n=1 Tax=Glomus cerebriforme TaxID=658196 RepID=A0A397TQP5_9GLOM|nr:nucleoside transporter-domain-containing protein [Glomus cerebriforme]
MFSRIYQFFNNVFVREDGREHAYAPVPNYGGSSQEREIIPPKDNYRIVYLIFLLQGVTMLLGWNVFITASVFFHESFRDSVYENNFQNYFSVVFMSSNLFFLGLALFTYKWENVSRRIIITIIFMVLQFLLIAISTQHVEFFGPTGYFYFVITLIGIAGATTAFQQNGIFALVSQFSPNYTLSVMIGQGLAGSAIAFFQILSAFATPPSTSSDSPTENDLSYSALLYFLCAFMITLLALISFCILIRLPLYEHYRKQARNIEITYDTNSIKATFYKIRTLAFVVGFVFAVTLSVFPSITASIKSTVKDENKSKFHQDYLFIPLHFLIFNLGDYGGRFLPSLQFFNITDSVKLARMSIARIIFLPIFLMCNVDVSGMRILPLMINNDIVYFLILWLFAVSGGYLGTLTMMTAPQVEGVAKDLAGTIMSFCLVLGLVFGSIFSFPMLAISCGCNPIENN